MNESVRRPLLDEENSEVCKSYEDSNVKATSADAKAATKM